MQAKQDFGELDLHAIAHLWNQGSVVRSWLLELAERAFERDPQLDQLRGWVDDSGEGRWTLEEAMQLSVPAPVLAHVADRALPVAPAGRLRQQGDRRAAQRVRRARGESRGRSGDAGITLIAEHPLHERRRQPRTPVPFCVVIFGASGDLTKRKLVPALYALAAEGSLPEGFTVIGAGRSEHDRRRIPRRHARGRREVRPRASARGRVGVVRRGTALRRLRHGGDRTASSRSTRRSRRPIASAAPRATASSTSARRRSGHAARGAAQRRGSDRTDARDIRARDHREAVRA